MPEPELPVFIVSGTRHATIEEHLTVIKNGIRDITWMLQPNGMQFHLVHGGARGADSIAYGYAQTFYLTWQATPVRARWKECGADCPPSSHRKTNKFGDYCPFAGPRRNKEMLDRFPGAPVVAFPAIGGPGPIREQSSGTWDMIEQATAAGHEVVLRPLHVQRTLW